MRQLNEDFLKKFDNEYKELLRCIVNDKELDMQIRDNYLNVYYKGGNILKIKPRSFDIDKMYFHVHTHGAKSSTEIKNDKTSLLRLSEQRKQLLALLPEQPREYFRQAKEKMDLWDRALSDKVQHEEKKEQQQIAIANRNNTDYVVLDLEYAVSRNSDFAYNGEDEKEVPRFDIIAIKEGILTVIELKKGLGALDNTSGIKPHIDCFLHTIGRDEKGLFIKEMQMLLKQKQQLGLLDKSLVILNSKPRFIFAFADEAGKDEFDKFVQICNNEKNKYFGSFIYLSSTHKLLDATNRSFYCQEQRKQAAKLKEYRVMLFDNAQEIGYSNKRQQLYDFILRSQHNSKNLYKDIRQDAVEYFKKYKIAWWQCINKPDEPTGHLVSSQIHCLNHLFALRTKKMAVKQIIENATGMTFDEVLPSLIDNDPNSFISFEFAFNNDEWLQENDKGSRRGTMCTSIDAMIIARKGNKKWLIPIEWKYTETYDRVDKTNRKRLDRYTHLIETSDRLLIPSEGVAHSVYFIEPSYELMRQTLLCEQIVSHKFADDFFHINVIPRRHYELRNAVEKEFIPMLEDKSKFKIVDPEELLSPLNGNMAYDELLKYLKKRYWENVK